MSRRGAQSAKKQVPAPEATRKRISGNRESLDETATTRERENILYSSSLAIAAAHYGQYALPPKSAGSVQRQKP